MKKIIWSLFDSETAITQQLNSDEYIVYSIGLPSTSAITDKFIKMDLSKKSCLKKLENLPKPDIIFASPPCETWVDVSIGLTRLYNRNFNEHNLYWQRNFKSNKFKKVFEQRRLLGQKTAYFTAEIIKKFKPELWCIENGSSSLIFKWINKFCNLQGYLNKCNYDSYNSIDFSKKPTTFFSNKKMLLKRTNVKNNTNRITRNNNFNDKIKKGIIKLENFNIKKDYCERSKVPIELYKHILSIYEGKEQLNLFL